MNYICAKNISSAYLELVHRVLKDGKFVHDERGQNTKELLNVVTKIHSPVNEYQFVNLNLPVYSMINPPKGTFWTGERLEKYCKEFTSHDRKGFVYTYGNRLGEWFDVDQIQEAIDRLKNCRESRRAISVTWSPGLDPFSDEVPCMILVDFKIRENKLCTTGLWRSHDIYGAWFANIVGLTYLAQYVAKELNIPVGPITVHSISAHIYENDKADAIKLLKENQEYYNNVLWSL